METSWKPHGNLMKPPYLSVGFSRNVGVCRAMVGGELSKDTPPPAGTRPASPPKKKAQAQLSDGWNKWENHGNIMGKALDKYGRS